MDRSTLDTCFRMFPVVWASLVAGVGVFTVAAWALASGTLAPGFSAALPSALASKLLVLAPLAMLAGIVHRNGGGAQARQPVARLDASVAVAAMLLIRPRREELDRILR